MANLQELISEYEIDPEVIEFLEFDETGYIDELMSENGIYIAEDVLNDIYKISPNKHLKLKMNELIMHRLGLSLLIPS